MKQTRRKELKTNELSIFLQQIRDAVTQHSNYVIGGIVLVVLILVIGLYVQSSRHAAETRRWNEYHELQREAATGIQPETIERATRLAQETEADPLLGPLARKLAADLTYQRALDMSPIGGSAERTELLETAAQDYRKLINTWPDRKELVAQARLGLASVAESLYVAGQENELQVAREQYQKVIEAGNTGFTSTAEERLNTLEERTRPMKIVATRPAEPGVAATSSAPATATAPAVETAPAAATGPALVPARMAESAPAAATAPQ